MGVASLVPLEDLWDGVADGVGVATSDFFFPFVSRVDLLRFDGGVLWTASRAAKLLVSLALGEEEVGFALAMRLAFLELELELVLVLVAAAAEAVSPAAPSLGAPPDRVLAIRSNASPGNERRNQSSRISPLQSAPVRKCRASCGVGGLPLEKGG
uniref:Uncharacterized protein n=1 Tax=Arundo donax TaxID=35708 RepID=A0A0A9CS96_ARUDO